MIELNLNEWQQFIRQYPQAHLLQIAEWGELKGGFGWRVRRAAVSDCGAQILFRSLPLGFSVGYIPRGPVGTPSAAFWAEVDHLARKERAVFLKVEPDRWGELSADEAAGLFPGFIRSPHSIQPPRTIVVSLEGGEDAILARMKQKTRYNIHLAERKGVAVQPCSDLGVFQELMVATGTRDGFGVHSQAYYQRVYDLFHPLGRCELLVASFEDRPLAGLMVFACGSRAWYLYGASNDEERNRMPTYLLQWGAMRWAIEKGCTEYDLWGVPDADVETLETGFETRSDGLWGVYRFKRGFGGALMRSCSAWDRVYNPLLYRIYRLRLRSHGEGGA
jgi:lipid II:glycine glycyltransferase (peptidoglycan interpeptide bridge formation enzyme)